MLYRELLDQGLSARTIRYTHAVLQSALRQAVRWRLLLDNPAESEDLPRQSRQSVGVLTLDQARAFIEAIAGHPYETLFALAMTTGMRPSEYLGLTWADLDLEKGSISVSKTLEWKKGGWQFADTKRARSRRVIKLQKWVIALLEKKRQGIAASSAKLQELIFTAQRGGPIRESRFVVRYFKPLLKAAGLPNIRLYDLRHTSATLGMEAGVSPKVISEQLGHASVAFTLDVYSHVMSHMQEAAAIKVESLLFGAASPIQRRINTRRLQSPLIMQLISTGIRMPGRSGTVQDALWARNTCRDAGHEIVKNETIMLRERTHFSLKSSVSALATSNTVEE